MKFERKVIIAPLQVRHYAKTCFFRGKMTQKSIYFEERLWNVSYIKVHRESQNYDIMTNIDPITQRLIAAASILSSCVLIALVYASLEIYNEIGILSTEFTEDYNEFNHASDKAWNKLISLRQKDNIEADFSREKRHSAFNSFYEGRAQNNQCS